MNVEGATGKSGFFWEDAGRIAEVRREGAAEVCEASGPVACRVLYRIPATSSLRDYGAGQRSG